MANMNNDLEIGSMLTISTAHISASTADIIEDIVNSTIVPYEYGWIMYVGDGAIPAENDLASCIRLARANNCDWLRLDRDGEIVHGLETFEWN